MWGPQTHVVAAGPLQCCHGARKGDAGATPPKRRAVEARVLVHHHERTDAQSLHASAHPRRRTNAQPLQARARLHVCPGPCHPQLPLQRHMVTRSCILCAFAAIPPSLAQAPRATPAAPTACKVPCPRPSAGMAPRTHAHFPVGPGNPVGCGAVVARFAALVVGLTPSRGEALCLPAVRLSRARPR